MGELDRSVERFFFFFFDAADSRPPSSPSGLFLTLPKTKKTPNPPAGSPRDVPGQAQNS